MRFSLRAKIVFFTAIPVLLTHIALLFYGERGLRVRAAEDHNRRMSETVEYRAALLDQQFRSIATIVDAAQQAGAVGAAFADELATRLLRQLPQVDVAAVIDPQSAGDLALTAREQGQIVRPTIDAGIKAQWRSLGDGWTIEDGDEHGTKLLFASPGGADMSRIVLQLTFPGLTGKHKSGPLQLLLVDAAGRVRTAAARAWTGTANIPKDLPDVPADPAGSDDSRARLFLADLPATGWRLGLLVDEKEIDNEVGDSARRLALALGASLVSILSIAWLIAQRLTRPLRATDASIEAITRGDPDAVPESYSRDGKPARAGIVPLRQQHEPTPEDKEGQRRLEHLIAETRATEEALRQARDEAQLASKAKSEFLSNMSHELRTPLNGVLGYAQILRRDRSMTDRQRESLDAIESCGQHLLTLINDVLDISRIEAGRMNVDIGPTDLQKLIKEVYDIVMQRAQSKGLALRVELDPTLPRVIRTDGTKLRQILLNLLGNAVKFTHEGWVALRAHDAGNGNLRVEVEDTGIGIPDDKVDMIFDPFKQAEAGMVIGGSGLGLAINQRLIELLGGEPLEVDTALDRGSRFTFQLPLEAVPENELPETQELMFSDEANVRLAPGQKVAVLVVDDRRENRDILRRLLSDAGFTVEEADNGRVAIQMMQDAKFDLILMDIRMPGMSGMEAIRIIREQPETKSQRVVAVTASVFPEFREQIKAAGFDEFLGKPFRSGELFHKIREVLQLRYVGLQQEEEPNGTQHPGSAPEGAQTSWPTALARAAIKRIRSAVELGDITALADLADKLRIDGRAPATDIDTIARLGRSFDFDGLTQFAKQLERNIG